MTISFGDPQTGVWLIFVLSVTLTKMQPNKSLRILMVKSHTSTYERYADDTRVHTSDGRITCKYIEVTYR